MLKTKPKIVIVKIVSQKSRLELPPVEDVGIIFSQKSPKSLLFTANCFYSGDYGDAMNLEFLKSFHRRRVQVLAESGADLIAFETVPNKLEAQGRSCKFVNEAALLAGRQNKVVVEKMDFIQAVERPIAVILLKYRWTFCLNMVLVDWLYPFSVGSSV